MSLVHNPKLMTRIRAINMREEERLRCNLLDLQQVRQDRLHALKVERQDLVHELRAHRMRVMRVRATRSLKEEDRLAMELRAVRGETPPHRHAPLRIFPNLEATRGFSKVDVEDDEDDIFLRAAQLQKSKTRSDFTPRASDNATELEYSEEAPYVPDEDILVYSPTEVGSKTWKKTVCIVPVSSTILSADYRRRQWEGKPPPAFRPETARSLKRSPSQPTYVKLLSKMDTSSLTQHTDGSMALAMRRFVQKQRERYAPPPGHLPVRRRSTGNMESAAGKKEGGKEPRQHPDATDSDELKQPDLLRAVRTSNPTAVKLHFHIPRTARLDRKVEENQENKRILRIRKAGQADTYEAALRSTSAFLGRRPSSVDLVQRVQLTREETVLLNHFQRTMSASDLMRGTSSSNS